jgi:hypothetical protein
MSYIAHAQTAYLSYLRKHCLSVKPPPASCRQNHVCGTECRMWAVAACNNTLFVCERTWSVHLCGAQCNAAIRDSAAGDVICTATGHILASNLRVVGYEDVRRTDYVMSSGASRDSASLSLSTPPTLPTHKETRSGTLIGRKRARSEGDMVSTTPPVHRPARVHLSPKAVSYGIHSVFPVISVSSETRPGVSATTTTSTNTSTSTTTTTISRAAKGPVPQVARPRRHVTRCVNGMLRDVVSRSHMARPLVSEFTRKVFKLGCESLNAPDGALYTAQQRLLTYEMVSPPHGATTVRRKVATFISHSPFITFMDVLRVYVCTATARGVYFTGDLTPPSNEIIDDIVGQITQLWTRLAPSDKTITVSIFTFACLWLLPCGITRIDGECILKPDTRIAAWLPTPRLLHPELFKGGIPTTPARMLTVAIGILNQLIEMERPLHESGV